MTYEALFREDSKGLSVTYDDIKKIEFFDKGVKLTTNDGFCSVWEYEDFTRIIIKKEV